jgi:hypothetical protein
MARLAETHEIVLAMSSSAGNRNDMMHFICGRQSSVLLTDFAQGMAFDAMLPHFLPS